MSKLVTVFGATGRQGSSVCNALFKSQDFTVRAVTRKPKGPAAQKLSSSGAEVIEGDIEDKTSRQEALQGAYGCFCVTKFWPHMDQTRETRQGIHVANSCKDAGVKHFIYSGLEHVKKATGLSCPFFDAKAAVEDYLVDNDIPFTSVRVASYMENYLSGNRPEKIENGTFGLFLPMGYAKLDVIPVDQVGECVVQIFRQREKYLGRIIGLASDRLTVEDMASIMAHHLGEDIVKGKITLKEFGKLKFAGAQDLANMFEFFQSGKCKRDIKLTQELNPQIQTFEQWVISNKRLLYKALYSQ